MSQNKKILIIQLDQFGYLTDSFKWCEYLKEKHEIRVVCYDSNFKKLALPNVHITYVKLSKYRVIHALKFFLKVLSIAFNFSGKIIVIAFPHCDIIKKVLFWKKIHLDIRTVSVSRDESKRISYDKKLHNYALLYDSISVIYKGVQQRLNIPSAKILPLGSDVISTHIKNYSNLNILYVGTLFGRDIEKTIYGLAQFVKDNPNTQIKYDIVGEAKGINKEKMSDEFKDLVSHLNLTQYIKIHGAKPYSDLLPFISEANYGVSFVPKTPWYDVQPPTKPFEYAMSGLYVIATSTTCNSEIISNENGILINDTPEDFAKALKYIYLNSQCISENAIRSSLLKYKWENIVNNYLLPIID